MTVEKSSPNGDTVVAVFQENGSGTEKINGILRYGKKISISYDFDITEKFPDFIEEPEKYIPTDFTADLVLCFLKHPDLVSYLATVCSTKKIPLIAAGKNIENAITPFTCCGLARKENLGNYGACFGIPELAVTVVDNRINRVEVLRGASCGATWEAIPKIIGLAPDEAVVSFAREVQYLCIADPSAFDPVTGKSALHFAGHIHANALKKGLKTRT